jgi:hypothetical protein
MVSIAAEILTERCAAIRQGYTALHDARQDAWEMWAEAADRLALARAEIDDGNPTETRRRLIQTAAAIIAFVEWTDAPLAEGEG